MNVKVKVSFGKESRDNIIDNIKSISKYEVIMLDNSCEFITTKAKYTKLYYYLINFPGYSCEIINTEYSTRKEYYKAWYNKNKDKHIKNVDEATSIKNKINNNRRKYRKVVDKALLNEEVVSLLASINSEMSYITLATLLGRGLVEEDIIVELEQVRYFCSKVSEIFDKARQELCEMVKSMGDKNGN